MVGSGGREHALAWKISQSPKVAKVFVAPGNGGTPNRVDIEPTNIDGLADFARSNDCFTVVGPEAPLVAGIVDRFSHDGLDIFGPTKKAAMLESSKAWAKGFMKRSGIPTAQYGVFEDVEQAEKYIESADFDMVVKADGLAAGKGVVVCDTKGEARDAARQMLEARMFGAAGGKIVIEERMRGEEASYIAISDGAFSVPMASSQDHKRAFDGDAGPNTGGMGAYSPAPIVDDALADEIQNAIVDRTVSAMADEGARFSGFLYAGIMIQDGRPYVLEYNVRMGDPECQPVVARMEFDLYDYLVASCHGNLESLPQPSWKNQSAVCVVLASKGYPGKYDTGHVISGLGQVPDGVIVFHAGTKPSGNGMLASGGRVLGVTALGDTLENAVDGAYLISGAITWPGRFYRTDIGQRGMQKL